jgi:acyl-CoA reductase-like NAD-dependent aldehyde dehydrogenase
MTATATRPELDKPEVFESKNPATGEVVATHPVLGPTDVESAVSRAREAAQWWQELGWDGRKDRLQRWKGVLARRAMELAELVHRENGKPSGDAFLEIMLTIDHLDWASKNAEKLLSSRGVSSGLMMMNQASTLEYQPVGVVGVIGPWNYPVFTPMGSIAYALAAGNAVVFKPSEFTPTIGAWLVDTFSQVVPEQPVFTSVTGFGETGAALCRSGIDKLAFTGSSATGRKVMATCAESLTPVLMECGGKDAMVVAEDADVDKAADAALWGGMSNAGQTCIGIERVYVADSVYDSFVESLTRQAEGIRPGDDAEASYGPITMPDQVDVIRRHIDDALSRGARAVLGGRDSVKAPFVEPVILVDVPEDSVAVQEETFGPTLTVTRVADSAEAVRLVNDTPYGLSASVFSKKNGMEIARAIRSGMASVNAVIAFAAVPSLPFGGVGESGFGRIHGEDGLKEFTRAKAITRQKFALPVALLSFQRPQVATTVLNKVIGLLHGRT